jgi:amino acid adenylation domain-containing protein
MQDDANHVEGSRADAVYRFPPTFGQEQLWYLHALAPESTAYNIAFAFTLRGALDADALERAIAALVRRHDALRTGFALVDEQLRQVVRGDVPVELERIDLADLPEDVRASRLDALRDACARHRFDLGAPSLLWTRLVRLGPGHHVLLLCVHHIVVDHLSILQLGRELAGLYAGDAALAADDGERLQLPDFAVWQRGQMDEATIGQRLAQWSGLLPARPATLELPTDRPRPPRQSFAGAEVPVCLPRELTARLRAHAQRERQSLFVVLLAAMYVVLHKYTAQRELIIGSPMANRAAEELQDVVGLLMNVLPIPVVVDPDEPFDAFAQQVRRQVAKVQGLEDTPFERLVQAHGGRHTAAHNPLAQVWFTFQDAPLSLALPGLEVESAPLHNGGAKFDLSFWFWDDAAHVRGLIEYDTDLFDADTARGLGEHLVEVVRAVVAEPAIRIADISLLSPAERAALRAPDVPAGVEADDALHAAFFALAGREPERPVLQTKQGVATAGALARQADAIAAELQRRGVARGEIVGVCLERDASLPAALLGVARSGAAWLPLDPTLPAERVAYMVQDSGLRLALVGAATRGLLPGDVRTVDVDAVDPSALADFAPPTVGGDDLAYVMYTSGSTGRPKGVRIPHGAVSNFLAAMRERPGIDRDDVVLALTTYAFDISVLELLLPLTVGAKVWLADRATAEDGAALRRLVETAGITLLQATPSTWRMLRASGWEGDAHLKALAGGEPLPPDIAAWLAPRVRELWNMYGPTETTVWSTCARIDAANAATCPIGTPIRRTTVHVVDERLRCLPAGVPGELAIGGRGLALGYHDRDALTAERFACLPETGERVYRTGDRVVRRRDGQLHHLGRNDHQVKIRGFRIELGEVEAVLAQRAELDAVAVRDWRVDADDHRLVAYYSTRTGAPLPAAELREHARALLPGYMLPQHFVHLPALPQTPNGKVDRKALPDPVATPDAAPVETPAAAAMTPEETLLVQACRELIGNASIGPDDNFFEAGGHSLLALTLMARVEKQTGRRLTILDLTTNSLGSLAQGLADGRAPAGEAGMGSRLSRWMRTALGPRPSVASPHP